MKGTRRDGDYSHEQTAIRKNIVMGDFKEGGLGKPSIPKKTG